MLGILVLTIVSIGFDNLSVQSAQGAGQNGTAKNMTSGLVNSTVSGVKNTTAAGNTTSNNNVTTASGNNGHIYRGGSAAGSGGE